jgi:uncharacterized membrane protein HdeD (DUF308 family)
MGPTYATPHVSTLASRWWALVVRGLAAIVFGVVAIVAPRFGLYTLVVLFGAYALVDGLFNLVLAGRSARAGRRWGWLLFEALISLLAGVFTFIYPAITALGMVVVVASWALLTGVAEIAVGARLRKQVTGEWLLITGGVLSIGVGSLMLVFPRAAALALVWLIAAYAIVFGVLLVGLGLRLHSWQRTRRTAVPPGAPIPA